MRIDVEVPTTLSDLDFYAQIGAFVSFELIHIVIILLGGIALFLFGMQLMGDGLKKVAVALGVIIMYHVLSQHETINDVPVTQSLGIVGDVVRMYLNVCTVRYVIF